MRNKLGKVCIFLGVLMLCASVSLYLHNIRQDHRAGLQAQAALQEIAARLPEKPSQEALTERLTPLEFRDSGAFEMTEVVINGYGYIGYLSLPTLELNLPIMGEWDGTRLQIAPCRYFGSVNGEDLVLMAHNYDTHFGRIKNLKAGDPVLFTDMDGITTGYQVISQDILAPDAVEEMTAGDFALTLFTCTYGGENRVSVYCDRQ